MSKFIEFEEIYRELGINSEIKPVYIWGKLIRVCLKKYLENSNLVLQRPKFQMMLMHSQNLKKERGITELK